MDAQRRNSIHCTAENSLPLPLPNFVCHIGPIFQISLIYAFIGCPLSVSLIVFSTLSTDVRIGNFEIILCTYYIPCHVCTRRLQTVQTLIIQNLIWFLQNWRVMEKNHELTLLFFVVMLELGTQLICMKTKNFLNRT